MNANSEHQTNHMWMLFSVQLMVSAWYVIATWPVQVRDQVEPEGQAMRTVVVLQFRLGICIKQVQLVTHDELLG